MSDKSYTEAAAELEANEAEYVRTKYSDELDRLKKIGFGIGEKWRKMEADHGRVAAELEVMFSMLNIECQQKREQQQDKLDKAEAPRKSFELDNWWYLHRDRYWPVNTDAALALVRETDSAFIVKQQATGFSTKGLEACIEEQQKQDSENVAWMKFRARMEEAAEFKQMSLQADLNSKAMKAKLEEMILDLVAAGVLHVGK